MIKNIKIKILVPVLTFLLYVPSAFSTDITDADYNYAMQLGYKEQGQGSLREFQRGDVNESIDPFTGTLKRVYTDAYIKLNYGLSFPILRTYTNLQNAATGATYRSPQVSPIGGRGVMGEGWDLHFGRIWTFQDQVISTANCHSTNLVSQWSPVLELPDGTRKAFYNAVAADELITSDFWRAKCLSSGVLEVYAPNGLKYIFAQRGAVTSGDSPDNHNQQKIAYLVSSILNKSRNANVVFDYKTAGSYVVLDKVRSAEGTLATFIYSYDIYKPWSTKLDSISIGGEGTISYSYSDFGGSFPSAQPFHLMSASLPDLGSSWIYSYYDGGVSPSGEGLYSLATAQSPSGVTTTYEYAMKNFSILSGPPATLDSVVVKKKTVTGTVVGSTWNYNYSTVTDGSQINDLTEVSHQGYSCTSYTHRGDKSIPSLSGYNNELSRMGILLNKKIYNSSSCSGNPEREEIYTWGEVVVPTLVSGVDQQAFRPAPFTITNGGIKHPVLNVLEIQIDGGSSSYFTENQNYNALGLPEQIIEYQSGAGAFGNEWTVRNRTIVYDSVGSPTIDDEWRYFQPKNEYICSSSAYCASNSANKIGWTERTFYGSGLPHVINENGVTTYFSWQGGGDLFAKEVCTGMTCPGAQSQLAIFKNFTRGVPKNIYNYGGGSISSRVVDFEGNVTAFYISGGAPFQTSSRLVDNKGNITSETIANDYSSTITGYSYDNANRLTHITTPSTSDNNIDITYLMGSGYRVTKTRGAIEEVQQYNGQGGLKYKYTKDTAGGGQMVCTSYDLDELNRVIFESYPYYGSGSSCPTATKGIATDYDAIGRVKSQKSTVDDDGSANSALTQYEYLPSNKTRITDERNKATTYTWYSYGSPEDRFLAKIEAPEGQTTSIHRNALGRINSIDQGGITQTFNYFSERPFQLESEIRPEITINYGRDLAGNMTSKTIGEITTNYTYDYLSRPLTIVNPDVSTYFTYTHVGALRAINSLSGGSLAANWLYSYDTNNNLISEKLTSQGNADYQVSYGITSDDYLNSVTYPDGSKVCYTPDNLGRATKVTKLSSGAAACGTSGTDYITSVQYSPNGALASYLQSNGKSVSITQTQRGLPDEFKLYSGGTNLMKINYDYDAVKNITNIQDYVDTANTKNNFAYDGLNRLKQVTGAWGTDNYTYHENGDFDTFSNVLAGNTSTLNYFYNGTTKRLDHVSIGATNYNYAYDALGNISANSDFTFGYDKASRLTSVTQDGLLKASYRYDGHNHRYQITDQAGSYLNFYSMAGQLMTAIDPRSYGSVSNYYYIGRTLLTRVDTCNKGEVDALGLCRQMDRDGDGLTDYEEVSIYGSNPDLVDGDGDGLTDYAEVHTYGTSPILTDTDGDTIRDDVEIANGTNALDSGNPDQVTYLVVHQGNNFSLETKWLLKRPFPTLGKNLSVTAVAAGVGVPAGAALTLNTGTNVVNYTSPATAVKNTWRYTVTDNDSITTPKASASAYLLIDLMTAGENLIGSDYDDVIITQGDVVIDGGKGNNIIVDKTGNNRLWVGDSGRNLWVIDDATATQNDYIDSDANADNVNLYKDGKDLIFSYRSHQSDITIPNALKNPTKFGINGVLFFGSDWDFNYPVAVSDQIDVVATSNVITFTTDTISLLTQNDYLPPNMQVRLSSVASIAGGNGTVVLESSWIEQHVVFTLDANATSGFFYYTITDVTNPANESSAVVSFRVIASDVQGITFNGDNNDNILGGTSGNDMFNSSKGYDIIDGIGGEDTINFGLGGDKDTFYYVFDDGGVNHLGDTINFTSLNRSDVSLERQGLDIVAKIKATDENIRLQDHHLQEATINSAIGASYGLMPFKQITFNDVSVSDSNFTTTAFSNLAYAAIDNATKTCTGGLPGSSCVGTAGNEAALNGSSGNDVMFGRDGADSMTGQGGDDILYGELGIDTIFGNAGDDELYGDQGVDQLIPGIGNNYMNGGSGKDVYFLDQNSGTNIIDNFDLTTHRDDPNTNTAALDSLWFTVLVTSRAQVKFSRSDDDLIVKVTDGVTASTSTVLNYFSFSGYNEVDAKFKYLTPNPGLPAWNGSCTTQALDGFTAEAGDSGFKCIKTRVLFDMTNDGYGGDPATGSGHDPVPIDDVLYGYDGADVINGYEGNDTIYAGQGVDTVHGGIGNDTVYPNWGSDTVYGDAGDDTLYGAYLYGFATLNGGSGNDTYVFKDNQYGYVVDIVSGDTSVDDRIQLLNEGLVTHDYWMYISGSDLVIYIIDNNIQAVVQNWSVGNNHLGSIEVGTDASCLKINRAQFASYMQAIVDRVDLDNDGLLNGNANGVSPTKAQMDAVFSGGSYWTACGVWP